MRKYCTLLSMCCVQRNPELPDGPVTCDAHPTLGTNNDLMTFPVPCTSSCRTGELLLVRLALVKSEPSSEIICREESDGRVTNSSLWATTACLCERGVGRHWLKEWCEEPGGAKPPREALPGAARPPAAGSLGWRVSWEERRYQWILLLSCLTSSA